MQKERRKHKCAEDENRTGFRRCNYGSRAAVSLPRWNHFQARTPNPEKRSIMGVERKQKILPDPKGCKVTAFYAPFPKTYPTSWETYSTLSSTNRMNVPGGAGEPSRNIVVLEIVLCSPKQSIIERSPRCELQEVETIRDLTVGNSNTKSRKW